MVVRIAIIPARGGSKRLPHKNILPLGGKPMLGWTVEAALQSGTFDKVLVSTDDAKIANIGRSFGADVPFLRDANADDHAPVSQAITTALSQAENHWQRKFDVVAQLMPNCPLRTSADIQAAVTHFDENELSFQISSFRFGWMNPWWAFKTDVQGAPESLFGEATSMRSQDLPELLCPTGAIWLARRDAFLDAGTYYGTGWTPHVLDWMSAIDIDDHDDFRMAEMAMLLRQKNETTPA